MILDHLSRAEKYYNVHSSFRHAFDYLKQSDLAGMNDGNYEIEGTDIYLILSTGMSSDALPKLETHKKYIDIQLTIDGSFPMGWKSVDTCTVNGSQYNAENDVQHYTDQPEFTVTIAKKMFAVVFPEDAHVGFPPKQHVRKAVVKVAV